MIFMLGFMCGIFWTVIIGAIYNTYQHQRDTWKTKLEQKQHELEIAKLDSDIDEIMERRLGR